MFSVSIYKLYGSDPELFSDRLIELMQQTKLMILITPENGFLGLNLGNFALLSFPSPALPAYKYPRPSNLIYGTVVASWIAGQKVEQSILHQGHDSHQA